MKKKNFITLVLGVIGGLTFSIGMCMCLLPQWNAFRPGVACTAVGLVVLLALLIIRWKTDGKRLPKLNAKAVGITLYSLISVLALGMGMSMIIVWNQLLWGILIGVVGILLLLGLIPMLKGLK